MTSTAAAMDESNEAELANNSDAVGDPQHESTSDLQAHDPIVDSKSADSGLDETAQVPETAEQQQCADSELDQTAQVPETAEQQQQREDNESAAEDTAAEVVGGGDGDDTTGKEPESVHQEQPTTKTNSTDPDPATTQLPTEETSTAPVDERPGHNALDDSIGDLSTEGVRLERESGVMPLPRKESSPSILALIDTQAPNETGPRITDHNGDLDRPLIAPTLALKQANIVEEEPESEEHQAAQSLDAVDIAIAQTDDPIHVPATTEASSKILDTAGHEFSGGHHGGQELADKEPGGHGEELESHDDEVMNDGPQGHDLQLFTTDKISSEHFEDDALSGKAQVASPNSHHVAEQQPETKDISDESDTSEPNESEKVDIHEMLKDMSRSTTNVQDLWSQRHQLFGEDIHSTQPTTTMPQNPRVLPQFSSNLEYGQYQASRHASHRPPGGDDPRSMFRLDYQRQQQMQHEPSSSQQMHLQRQRRQNYYAGKQPDPEVPVMFDQSRASMPPTPMAPMNYRNIPPSGYQYAGFAQYPTAFQNPGHPTAGYVRMPPDSARGSFPSHGYSVTSRPPALFMPDNWQTGPHRPTVEARVSYEKNHKERGGISDDDEPLKTRVKRHPSVVSLDSLTSASSPAGESKHMRQIPGQDHDSDAEFPANESKSTLSLAQNPVRMQRPLPRPRQESISAPSSPSSGNGIGSWKLPEFEVQRQPIDKKEELPSVKVSLPNMVREELLLSPDHSEQEVHLLLHLFLPGQQALDNPDSAPATALLNFHTIAVMVIEAFVQFEIGDEFGLGRGHFHQNHDQDEEEYERMRDAKDADIDEIFFAVIDRWRAGIESRKQALTLIRGAQEFCDVALDVIYYIKEHGLLQPEPKAPHVSSDKGTKRGPRKSKEEDATQTVKSKGKGKVDAAAEGKTNRAVKRAASPKVNTLQSRKKVKAEKPAKKRTKSKAPEITVIKRR